MYIIHLGSTATCTNNDLGSTTTCTHNGFLLLRITGTVALTTACIALQHALTTTWEAEQHALTTIWLRLHSKGKRLTRDIARTSVFTLGPVTKPQCVERRALL